MWDEAKAVLTGKFLALNANVRKEMFLTFLMFENQGISFHIKKLEKEGQIKSTVNRRKEIIMITIEIKGMDEKASPLERSVKLINF